MITRVDHRLLIKEVEAGVEPAHALDRQDHKAIRVGQFARKVAAALAEDPKTELRDFLLTDWELPAYCTT